MKLSTIVKQIRQYVPIFSGRVATSLSYELGAVSTQMTRPCAYVSFDSSDFEEAPKNGLSIQNETDRFSIFVEVDGKKGDERAQMAVDVLDEIRRQLFLALIGFEPAPEYEPIQASAISTFDGNRALVVFRFEFSVGRRVGRASRTQPAETWQEAQVDGLKPFEGMDIDVDVIDPIAQPRPGPDGRIEFETHVEFEDEKASHG